MNAIKLKGFSTTEVETFSPIRVDVEDANIYAIFESHQYAKLFADAIQTRTHNPQPRPETFDIDGRTTTWYVRIK